MKENKRIEPAEISLENCFILVEKWLTWSLVYLEFWDDATRRNNGEQVCHNKRKNMDDQEQER